MKFSIITKIILVFGSCFIASASWAGGGAHAGSMKSQPLNGEESFGQEFRPRVIVLDVFEDGNIDYFLSNDPEVVYSAPISEFQKTPAIYRDVVKQINKLVITTEI